MRNPWKILVALIASIPFIVLIATQNNKLDRLPIEKEELTYQLADMKKETGVYTARFNRCPSRLQDCRQGPMKYIGSGQKLPGAGDKTKK